MTEVERLKAENLKLRAAIRDNATKAARKRKEALDALKHKLGVQQHSSDFYREDNERLEKENRIMRDLFASDAIARVTFLPGRKDGSVWLVNGSTGEYGDFSSWTVCAFDIEAEATLAANRWNAWLQERGFYDACLDGDIGHKGGIKDCPFDPALRVDYGGACYTIEMVVVRTIRNDGEEVVDDW